MVQKTLSTIVEAAPLIETVVATLGLLLLAYQIHQAVLQYRQNREMDFLLDAYRDSNDLRRLYDNFLYGADNGQDVEQKLATIGANVTLLQEVFQASEVGESWDELEVYLDLGELEPDRRRKLRQNFESKISDFQASVRIRINKVSGPKKFLPLGSD